MRKTLALTKLLAALAVCTAGCSSRTIMFSFSAPEDLMPVPADKASIVTADVAVNGSELLVSAPFTGTVQGFSCHGASCSARTVGEGLGLPVRATAADLSGNGEPMTLVADVGSPVAAETSLGRVLAVAPDGQVTTVLSGLGRTVCAHAADLDGDGDMDVLGCVFGNQTGEVVWAEHLPNGGFTKRTIDTVAGASQAAIFDADQDGDLDVAAVISQNTEEVRLYRNQGNGTFATETLEQPGEPCHGFSNLSVADLDHDGDTDLLVTNGDDMDDECHGAFYHGHHRVEWLENDGAGKFQQHPIVVSYGAYSVQAADLNDDGHLDLVLASYGWDPAYSPPMEPDWAPLVWLENDGRQGFVRHVIAGAPAAVISIAVTDVDGDGVPDLVSGSMNEDEVMPEARPLVLFRGKRETL